MTTPTNDLKFGRLPNPLDPRDQNFTFAAKLATLPPVELPVAKVWTPPDNVLNQGNLGACVAFAGAAWLEAEPVVQQVTNNLAFWLYGECKKIDGIPNTEGTYSRALMKVVASQSAVGSYHWASSMQDFDEWLLTQGPILIGIPWFQGMLNSDGQGNVSITGALVGGHEVCVYGLCLDGRYVIRNSWGANWGYHGDCYFSRAQMEQLLFGNNPAWPYSDACAAYQIGAIFNPGDVMPAPAPFLERMPWGNDATITQEFGEVSSGYPHRGRDAQTVPPIGADLVACAPGTVTTFVNSLTEWPLGSGIMVPAFGVAVCIHYDSGLYGLIAHGSGQALVSPGQRVTADQVVLRSGYSGVVDPPGPAGAHCHFQVCVNSDFPTDIRASYDPRTLLMEDEMSAADLERLARLESIVAGNAVKIECYPGWEDLIGVEGGFPAGTVPCQVVPPDNWRAVPGSPTYTLTGEPALLACQRRGFSFALGLRNTQVAQQTHINAGDATGDTWHHTGG